MIMPDGQKRIVMTTLPARVANPRRKEKASSGRSVGLGHWADDPMRLVRLVRKGLPYDRLARLQKATSLPWEELARWVQIPARTLARRRRQGRLRADESDRLVRAMRLFDMAVGLFEGDAAAAMQWLQAPQHGLGGEVPIEMASTDIGARQVEDLIMRLEHGVFA
jgi:putative toxin-antitoxin system antitoxin component (TIGR02293 family)